MNVSLRPATDADAVRVAEVLLSSRKAFLPYACFARSDAEFYQWVRDVLIPAGGVTVACSGGLLVGVLATAREAGVSWVNHLYLAPSHVGQGIGSKLLAHALATLPLPVRLYTFQANTRGRRFYERYGFEAIQFTDGRSNEERCPDVLYELASSRDAGA